MMKRLLLFSAATMAIAISAIDTVLDSAINFFRSAYTAISLVAARTFAGPVTLASQSAIASRPLVIAKAFAGCLAKRERQLFISAAWRLVPST